MSRRGNNKKIKYSEVVPSMQEWPIVQLAKNRKEFIEDVAETSLENVLQRSRGRSLREELEMTVYREKLRIKGNPWKVDPEDDRAFWKTIQHRLAESQSLEKEEADKIEQDLLKEIVMRYANEIAGNFKKSSYRFARSFVTVGFARLLNAARVGGLRSIFSRQLDLDDKIHILGYPEHIRNLAKKGTVVMVPTHFSNLDSILIGWVIQFLGLPPFIYGAGLNLFNIRLFAYFMNSLGAYKVDRRKKNPVYLEALKTYSTEALRKGCHSLFFPGGTRSRSGMIEKALKLGLLSTTIEAQRINYQKDGEKATKIFIVPVVINYHFTLEAPSLINNYLKIKGQERYYVENDEYSTSYKIATFLLKFFTKGSNISVAIGKGMDVLGNYVDDEGNSLDTNGNIIDPKDYFITDGEVTVDHQREHEYVRILGKRIVEEYHIHNRVFASHLVAFLAFKIVQKKNDKLDLYNLLRLPEEDLELDYEEFKEAFKKLRKKIFKLNKKGKVGVAEHLTRKADDAILHGIKNVGMYHARRPLVKKGKDKIQIQDMNTLYYYHNRMEGYGLEKFI
ncbi:MAG: 1-acyl-sn-glycerol-3-phosphate acyltransferase [bacterium]|nr:1-acyl-sn-glycerol-3-phosphate acyltransferase [bacterium]